MSVGKAVVVGLLVSAAGVAAVVAYSSVFGLDNGLVSALERFDHMMGAPSRALGCEGSLLKGVLLALAFPIVVSVMGLSALFRR